MSVAAPVANPAVDELFREMREATGQQVTSKNGAVRVLLSALRSQGNIALLLDQNTKPSEGGVFVNFFGLPVPVSAAAASLAYRTGAEIAFGFCLPDPDGGCYRIKLGKRIAPASEPKPKDLSEAMTALTQQIADEIEAEVRTNPGAWLWMYKRWKYVAPGRRRDEYPFYAKELSSSLNNGEPGTLNPEPS